MKIRTLHFAVALAVTLNAAASMLAGAAEQAVVRTGKSAFGDWTTDAPGVRRKITAADLPPPFATESVGNVPRVVAPPEGAMPKVPAGFKVEQFASGLRGARLLRVAPNGDIFIAESYANRIRILRAADGASKPERSEVFASRLDQPFGIAFWPPGPSPKFIYVGNTGSVVRFPYQAG